jgi:type I restriction enzyme R subunit
MNPEQQARQQIDAALTQCGWFVQDYKALDLSAGRGIALREVPLKGGTCDYLILVDRKPAGVIEAKPEVTTLSGVADQSAYYGDNLPDSWHGSATRFQVANAIANHNRRDDRIISKFSATRR